jgi:peptidoglycan hydrolase-like protein with peptidoglycan-binding domain
VINAGTAPVSINGLPVVALSTSVPLWRDINVGDSGADVLSLQNELLRLGISVVADGYFGWTDAQAVDLLFQGLGDAEADFDGMPLGRSMWLPSALVTPSSCDVAVGAQVGPGDTLATLPGTPTRAVVVNYPKDLLAGDRVLNVDGNVIPVNADGTITDSPSLVVLATLSAASATSDDAAAPVPGTLLLSSPVAVAVVPPTSVYKVEDAEGCVVADGRVMPVRVVGSQLGQTFVLFEGETPNAVSTSPGGDLPCR